MMLTSVVFARQASKMAGEMNGSSTSQPPARQRRRGMLEESGQPGRVEKGKLGRAYLD